MAPVWRSKLGAEFPRELIEGLDAEHLCALRKLRAEPHNAHCAECGRTNNTWASVNLGVFLCDRCADVHRALGSHISKVKSCTGSELWGPDEIARMQELDLVLPNKQIHCSTKTASGPTKEELMDHCLKKYGMTSSACEKLPPTKRESVAPPSIMKIANASRNGWRDPFADPCTENSAVVPPVVSDRKPKKGLQDSAFNFDDFFADMERNDKVAHAKDYFTKEGRQDAILSTTPVVEDTAPSQRKEDVNQPPAAYAASCPGSLVAPTAAALKRSSTDEMWDFLNGEVDSH